jgi:hypothetical protein
MCERIPVRMTATARGSLPWKLFPPFSAFSKCSIPVMRNLTYTWELHAAVTAFRRAALLLDVQVSELAAGGLDHTDFVGPRVVPREAWISYTIPFQSRPDPPMLKMPGALGTKQAVYIRVPPSLSTVSTSGSTHCRSCWIAYQTYVGQS